MPRDPGSFRRGLVLVALVLVAGLSGCLGSEAPQPAAGPGDRPMATDPATTDSSVALQDGSPTGPRLAVTWTLLLVDLRTAPWDPPGIAARITWNGSLPDGSLVRITWQADGDGTATDERELPTDGGQAEQVREFPLPPGVHTVTATAALHHGGQATAPQSVTLDATVWHPLRVVVNASETYASDQNVFREDRLVPFAAWDDESTFDLLNRMAERHGFTVRADYREDLDSWFVNEINGTAFQWERPEILGISRNWMLLLNGEETQTAVDDTFPAVGDVVEFRYVRCHSTGQCEGT